MYGRSYDAAMGLCLPRVALTLRTPRWGFQPVRGGIDPGGNAVFVPGLELMYAMISNTGWNLISLG